MIGFIVILILLAAAAGAAYYYFVQTKPQPSIGPSTETELVITEDGASLTENYRIMPKREKYIQMPDVAGCQKGADSEMCNAYDKNNGFAFVYDLSLADVGSPRYESCPGGGHDCWYTEKYDEEGTLIAVTDKNGVSMLDKIADDIWSGKWDMENNQLVKEITNSFEFKDGSLVAKRQLSLKDGGKAEIGDKVKPTEMPGSMYFVALFSSMKIAGEEKPAKIKLNIKGSKDSFKKFVRGSRIDQSQGVSVDLKKSEKPMKFELYDKPDCKGKVIRSIGLGSNINLNTKFEIKSQNGDQQKACCMKTENVKIVMGKATSDTGVTEFNRTQLEGEKTTNLPGCPNDYMFSFSPLQ